MYYTALFIWDLICSYVLLFACFCLYVSGQARVLQQQAAAAQVQQAAAQAQQTAVQAQLATVPSTVRAVQAAVGIWIRE